MSPSSTGERLLARIAELLDMDVRAFHDTARTGSDARTRVDDRRALRHRLVAAFAALPDDAERLRAVRCLEAFGDRGRRSPADADPSVVPHEPRAETISARAPPERPAGHGTGSRHGGERGRIPAGVVPSGEGPDRAKPS